MDLDLKDTVALITASSKGLGRAAALQLAQEGAQVAICARGINALHATARDIESLGGQVLAMEADLSEPQAAEILVQGTLDRFGKLDMLIANAGGPAPGGFLSLDEGAWESAIELTLMSVVRLCYASIPALRDSERAAILVSTSVSVKQPLPNLVLSNSLRLGVIGLVKSLADELGPKGIRVNAICPGWTRTDRVEQLLQDRTARNSTSLDQEAAQVTQAIPLGRMADPGEFARAAAFLVSPAASYITGVSLLVDGGMYRGTM